MKALVPYFTVDAWSPKLHSSAFRPTPPALAEHRLLLIGLFVLKPACASWPRRALWHPEIYPWRAKYMRACLRLHAVRLVFFGAGTLGLKGKPTGNPKPAWGFQILKRRAAHFIARWLANSAHGFQASLPLAPGPGTRSSTQEPWFPFRDFLTLRAKKNMLSLVDW